VFQGLSLEVHMRPFVGCVVALITLISLGVVVSTPHAEPAEKRIALVIGNAGYQAGALRTAANDAGLIAQTLQAAGFDVVGARDLDQDSLRRAFRDFLEKASSSGPNTVAFAYLSGYALQLEGEDYFLPVDAKIGRAADVAAEAVRISDYIRPLGALKLKASIIVLDAARRNPFSVSGEPLAGGLALVEPSPGMLVAFNAAPGTIAPEQNGPYGAYAQALAEMIREGGLTLQDLFDRVRLRVNDMTKGAQVPWNSSRIEASFVFFERSPDAPPPTASTEQSSTIRSRPVAELGAEDAYVAALERDTLEAYEEFLAAYPDDPMAKRVRAIIAARREAITWRRSYAADTPDAYWSYLRRYPHGPHGADARRRLALRAMAFEPPPSFAEIDYDVPPPPPEEGVYVDRPVLAFDDPDFGFAPLPPPPIYFLPPPPPEFVVLAEPPPAIEAFVLPIPVFVPLPVWCHPPVYVAPPPDNVIFSNIHNTIIFNHATRDVTIRDRSGQIVSSAARRAHGAGVLALAPALPPSIAKKVAFSHSHGSEVIATNSTQRLGRLPLGQPLPGSHGRPLPPLSGKSAAAPVGTPSVARSSTLNTLHPIAPGSADTLSPHSAFAHSGPISNIPERSGKLPLGQSLPGSNGHPLPPLPGKSLGAPAGRSSTAVSAPVNAPHPPAPGPVHALPSQPANSLTLPGRPTPTHTQPPQFAARPPSPTVASPPAPNALRTTPPATTPHGAPPPPPTVRPTPPVQALRPPPPPAPTYRPPPPAQVHRPAPAPAAAIRPPSPPPPVYRPAPAPAAAVRPPSPPPPVYRPPPPPVVHAAPPPAVRAAPAPPPVAHRPPPAPAKRT
jgi:uncharacterized caspase-like protein